MHHLFNFEISIRNERSMAVPDPASVQALAHERAGTGLGTASTLVQNQAVFCARSSVG